MSRLALIIERPLPRPPLSSLVVLVFCASAAIVKDRAASRFAKRLNDGQRERERQSPEPISRLAPVGNFYEVMKSDVVVVVAVSNIHVAFCELWVIMVQIGFKSPFV